MLNKGYASNYSIKVLNSFNLELQFKNTKYVTKNKLIYLLTEKKGFKFVTTLVVELKKKYKIKVKQNKR